MNKKCGSGRWKKSSFFQQPLPYFLHLRGQIIVILNKLEISPSLFNHHYGFQPKILTPTASQRRRDSRDCEFDLNLKKIPNITDPAERRTRLISIKMYLNILKSMHLLGAQVQRPVHPASKMCTLGAGCTLNFEHW